jgi:DNA-directed RNA polymerase subunit RPC12/RpoP
MECVKCGRHLGSHQVHPEAECNRQQEINRGNLGIACRWCGHQAGGHKDGCPRAMRGVASKEEVFGLLPRPVK